MTEERMTGICFVGLMILMVVIILGMNVMVRSESADPIREFYLEDGTRCIEAKVDYGVSIDCDWR